MEQCGPSMRDLRGTTIDRYRVERLLGSGGMGSVWEVRHAESLQTYALKTMHAGAATDRGMLERFLREARAAAALKSKHVVKIVDAQINYVDPATKTPLPFMVMELLEGEPLERLIQRQGALPPGEALWVLRQVAKGLEAAHTRGIVHRDLKPENVFLALDEDGEPITKVCDFGIAKLVGDAAGLVDSNALGTQTGLALGTPLYMSPEQARNASSVGPPSDQWAFALIAYRALTGGHFFGSNTTTAELLIKIVADPILPPRQVAASLPEAFDNWFLRSLDRNPEMRFPSIADQVAALATALGEPPLVAPTVEIASAPPAPEPTPSPDTTPSASLAGPSARRGATPSQRTLESAETMLQPSQGGTIAAASVNMQGEAVLATRSGVGRKPAFVAALLGAALVGGGVVVLALREPPRTPTVGAPAASESSHAAASTTTGAGTSATAPTPSASATSASATPSASTSTPPSEPTKAPPKPVVTVGTKKPPVAASTSAAAPATTAPPVAKKLPAGASCTRSNECESALCVAEVCK